MTLPENHLINAGKDFIFELYERTVNDNKEDFDTLYWTIAKLVSALEEKNILDPEEIVEILKVEKMPDLTGSEMPESEASAWL